MGFTKGNKLGKGRPKGSLNESTEALRGYLMELLEDNKEKLKEDLALLKPLERVNVYISLCKIVLPSLKTTDINLEVMKEQPLLPFSYNQKKN